MKISEGNYEYKGQYSARCMECAAENNGKGAYNWAHTHTQKTGHLVDIRINVSVVLKEGPHQWFWKRESLVKQWSIVLAGIEDVRSLGGKTLTAIGILLGADMSPVSLEQPVSMRQVIKMVLLDANWSRRGSKWYPTKDQSLQEDLKWLRGKLCEDPSLVKSLDGLSSKQILFSYDIIIKTRGDVMAFNKILKDHGLVYKQAWRAGKNVNIWVYNDK